MYKKRIVSFTTDISGLSEQDISIQRQAIASILSGKRGRLKITFHRTNNESDENNTFFLKEVTGKADYPADSRSIDFQLLRIELTAYDPYFYGVERSRELTNNLLGNGLFFPIAFPISFEALFTQTELKNRGDVDAEVFLTFDGILNNMKITNETDVDSFGVPKFIQLITDLTDIQELVIDGKNRLITIDDANAFDLLTEDSKFFVMKEGTNTIIFNAGNVDPNSKVTLRYEEKYLSI